MVVETPQPRVCRQMRPRSKYPLLKRILNRAISVYHFELEREKLARSDSRVRALPSPPAPQQALHGPPLPAGCIQRPRIDLRALIPDAFSLGTTPSTVKAHLHPLPRSRHRSRRPKPSRILPRAHRSCARSSLVCDSLRFSGRGTSISFWSRSSPTP